MPDVREQLKQRVSQLKSEHQKGQQMLAELESQQAELRQTLLRIAGAIQVLEELLAAAEPSPPDSIVPPAGAARNALVNAGA